MIRQSFNVGWTAGPQLTGFARMTGSPERAEVTLPHDAVRDLRGRPTAWAAAGSPGYFPRA